MCDDCIYPNGEGEGAVCSRKCALKYLAEIHEDKLNERKRLNKIE
jgi:hypothetical protein